MTGKLFLIVFALALSFVLASPTKKSNYIEQENSCREVCGLCDCDGFYCEDECICECSLDNEENLQCIADMKTECDANGLEYELMMEESTKERFLRQVKDHGINFDKHLFVMKHKRDSNSTSSAEPIVGAAAPEASAAVDSSSDPVVAAPADAVAAAVDSLDSTLGNPVAVKANGLSALGGLGSLSAFSTSLRSGAGTLPAVAAFPAVAALPAVSTLPALTGGTSLLPSIASARSLDFSKLSIILRDRLTATRARLGAVLPSISTASAVAPAAVVAPAAAIVAPSAAASAARSALLAKIASLRAAPAAAAVATVPAACTSSLAGLGGLSSLPSLSSLAALKGAVV